uniref:WAS/WASL interacting protein family member 3 n=1 Tax=Oryzias melastigma TaxID=30732 RepID=A0A3B3CGX9_ORYME
MVHDPRDAVPDAHWSSGRIQYHYSNPVPWPSDPVRLQSGEDGGGRSALLADIQRGAKLRKVTQVNDRSGPIVDKPKVAAADTSGGKGSMGPSLGGLFAAGFPTLRPTAHRDLAGKISGLCFVLLHHCSNPSAAMVTIKVTVCPKCLDPTRRPRSGHCGTPPHQPTRSALWAFTGPAISDCWVTKPTWLPVHHCHSVSQPSTPPPPPPPPPPVQGDRSSGCFYSPPASAYSEPSRFPILRDSPLGPPPPPPAPPLPASFSPSCPSTLPPPPPRAPSVPSLSVRSLPPSYPCNAPTRRPPAVPRSAGASRLAPPPAPPARSPTTELSCRIPPPPPPLPPFSLRNGHLHGLDDFESKFQFHPVEDLPPPDEFKPFPRIYPSKENRVNPKPPGIRTHLR